MKTLGLLNGDLNLENGDFVLIEGPEEIAQCIAISFGTNLKEWFLNEEEGLDFTKILEKSTDDEARAEVLRVLSKEDRIATIDSLEIVNDYKSRKRTIKYTVTLVDGTTLSEEVSVGA
ncbi:DUF2634 domain-containing protein [Lysinibacillus telephonicus]|uniref:DUF2634 domain-containing protein n=1 Tax=Lysinibacillus telephonicus TaxID=1714840 RepID=UPI0031FCD56F